ncbi:hypothetical protein B4U79_19209, partial [Dinothrombium tinctorium]
IETKKQWKSISKEEAAKQLDERLKIYQQNVAKVNKKSELSLFDQEREKLKNGDINEMDLLLIAKLLRFVYFDLPDEMKAQLQNENKQVKEIQNIRTRCTQNYAIQGAEQAKKDLSFVVQFFMDHAKLYLNELVERFFQKDLGFLCKNFEPIYFCLPFVYDSKISSLRDEDILTIENLIILLIRCYDYIKSRVRHDHVSHDFSEILYELAKKWKIIQEEATNEFYKKIETKKGYLYIKFNPCGILEDEQGSNSNYIYNFMSYGFKRQLYLIMLRNKDSYIDEEMVKLDREKIYYDVELLNFAIKYLSNFFTKEEMFKFNGEKYSSLASALEEILELAFYSLNVFNTFETYFRCLKLSEEQAYAWAERLCFDRLFEEPDASRRNLIEESLNLIRFKKANRNKIFGVDRNEVEIDDIHEIFSSHGCPQLVEKPKIFIFSTCSSKRNSDAINDCSSVDLNECSSKGNLQMQADMKQYKEEKRESSTCYTCLRLTDVFICHFRHLPYFESESENYHLCESLISDFCYILRSNADHLDFAKMFQLLIAQCKNKDYSFEFSLKPSSYDNQIAEIRLAGVSKLLYFNPSLAH